MGILTFLVNLPRAHISPSATSAALLSRRVLRSLSSKSTSDPLEIQITDSDVESDEALWDLYQRWRRVYKARPTVNEGRFGAFKDNAIRIHKHNKMGIPPTLSLSKLSYLTPTEVNDTSPADIDILCMDADYLCRRKTTPLSTELPKPQVG